ncbi:uncharacterized protein LOC141906221 [Tubulanus polymorphus]|uniref:uncharacterized protein LOC141906221 n=1 Tax=Tubulanus polymorphus TaxID=672921 RepID=UPI003DA3D535
MQKDQALQDYSKEVLDQLAITDEQIQNVEMLTWKQSESPVWFSHRAGRITASILKFVTRTSIDKPSRLSLIKRICYPKAYSFSTKATRWGCKHEETARSNYEQLMNQTHINCKVKESGFYIDKCYPFLGASPVGVVPCDCCGIQLIEIKCPFCLRDKTAEEAASNDHNFCMEIDSNGALTLKRDHAYYYQIQTQLHAT